jgi:hypothetical protein
LEAGCFLDEFRIEVLALSKLFAQEVSSILSTLVSVGCEERGNPPTREPIIAEKAPIQAVSIE